MERLILIIKTECTSRVSRTTPATQVDVTLAAALTGRRSPSKSLSGDWRINFNSMAQRVQCEAVKCEG